MEKSSNHSNSGNLQIVPKNRSDKRTAIPSVIQIDAAISKTNFGLFNYVIIFVCAVILYGVSAEISAILYVIPVSQCDLNLTLSQKGILASAGFLGVIFSSHLWGYLADTQGRRRVIQPTLFAAFALTIICSFVEDFYIFTVLRFLNGFFLSCASGTIYVYLGEFHNNAQRSRTIMSCATIYASFCILLPLTAWGVINLDWECRVPLIDITYKPWRLYLIVNALPGFLGAVALCFLPETPKFVLSQGDQEATQKILQKMSRWNNGGNKTIKFVQIIEEEESVERRKSVLECQKCQFPLFKNVWDQTAPLFETAHLKTTILISIIQFGMSTTSIGFFMFFAEILNKMSTNLGGSTDQRMMMCDIINLKPANMSSTDAISEFCVSKLELSTLENGVFMELIFATGSFIIGLLITRVGKSTILFCIGLITGLGGFGCMLTDIPELQVFFFLTLLSCGIALNVMSAVTVELYPTGLRAMALSVSCMFARLGGVTGSNAAAFLLDNYCEATFYLSGSVLIVMGALAFFIPNINKGISKSHQNQIEFDAIEIESQRL